MESIVEEVFETVAPLWALNWGGYVTLTTAEHPFYVRGKGWTAAEDLQPGDQLRSHKGAWYGVDHIRPTGTVATVYNLRVAGHHTYFIQGGKGSVSAWVHNTYEAPNREVSQSHPDLPIRKHSTDPTHGILNDRIKLRSGRNGGDAEAVFKSRYSQLSKEARSSLKHVEGHAAAEMIKGKLTEAVLHINY